VDPEECSSTKDCPGSLVCDTEAHVCVECLEDADCADDHTCGPDRGCHPTVECSAAKDCKAYDMVCDKDAGLCVECLGDEDCADIEFCLEKTCAPDACEPEVADCDGNAVVVCTENGGAWKTAVLCQGTEFCLNGECYAHLCPPGETFCDGAVLKTCDDLGAVIVEEVDCEEDGLYCFEGECSPTLCKPGGLFCQDDYTVAHCNDSGSDFTPEACEEGHYCLKGECLPFVCLPGQTLCEESVAVTCNAKGSAIADEVDCLASGQFCLDGQCHEPACGETGDFCANPSTAVSCLEEGGFHVEPCAGSKHCDQGQCVPQKCTPGEPLCDGALATVCDEWGGGPAPGGQDCEAAGTFCVDGECIVCYPNCFGKMCGGDGCGGTCGDCNDGDVCTIDSCEEEIFVCHHEVVEECCHFDEECNDGDNCTLDFCTDNGCVWSDLCCESHGECDDNDDCTHDLCLNSYCWHKLLGEEDCCPKHPVSEGFEQGIAWKWALSLDGNKSWTVVDTEAHTGTHSLACSKAQSPAVTTLPEVEIPWTGASLEFWYRTVDWNAVDCQTMGIRVLVNDAVAGVVCQAASEWTFAEVDLSPWAGATATLRLQYVVGNAGNPYHQAYVDDLTLSFQCCQQDWDCQDTDPCTKDKCSPDGTCVYKEIPGCCTPALLQEDFELGTAWQWLLSQDGQKWWQVSTEDAHTGSHAFIATDVQNGALATLPADILVPVGGGALEFWYKTVNWNVMTWGVDGLTVYVNGQQVEVVSTPAPEWTPLAMDLSPWAGQTVTLQLKYLILAGGNPQHRVFVDDLQVLQNCCDVDEECDDASSCTDDTCGTWGACIHDPDPACCQPSVFKESFDSGLAWKWFLGKGDGLDWSVIEADAKSGTHSLYVDGWDNHAEATLPLAPVVPVSGAQLRFYYKSANWLVMDCEVDGVALLVNGTRISAACENAADWTLAEVDLSPWAGQEVSLSLKYGIVSGGNKGHLVYVDDVEYLVECCAADEDCQDGNPCTTDTCNSEWCNNFLDEDCCNPDLFHSDFEKGTAWDWVLSNDGIKKWAVTSELAKEGSHSLGCNQANDWAVATLPAMPQIPWSGAAFQFYYSTVNWLEVDCNNEGILVYVNGTRVAIVCEAVEWGLFSVDLSPWAGKEVVIKLAYHLNPALNSGHQVFVDDVALVAECCEAADDCSDGNACTEETCTDGGKCIHEDLADCCNPSVFLENFEFGTAWGWNLAVDGVKKWMVTSDEANNSTYALVGTQAYNGAVALLPPVSALPLTGGYLQFSYKTVAWNVINCDWMGVSVFVNGVMAERLCEPALEWTSHTIDLFPWAGQDLVVKLKYHVGDGNNPAHAAYLDDMAVVADCP